MHTLAPLVIKRPIVNWVAMVCHFEKVGQQKKVWKTLA